MRYIGILSERVRRVSGRETGVRRDGDYIANPERIAVPGGGGEFKSRRGVPRSPPPPDGVFFLLLLLGRQGVPYTHFYYIIFYSIFVFLSYGPQAEASLSVTVCIIYEHDGGPETANVVYIRRLIYTGARIPRYNALLDILPGHGFR